MLKPRLQELCICRPILEDALIGKFLYFLENPENTSHAYDFTAGLIEKAESLGLSGNILRRMDRTLRPACRRCPRL